MMRYAKQKSCEAVKRVQPSKIETVTSNVNLLVATVSDIWWWPSIIYANYKHKAS